MTINTDTVHNMAKGVIYLLEKGARVHPNVAFENNEWTNDKIHEYENQLNQLIYYNNCHPEKPLISQFIHNLNEYAKCIDYHTEQLEMCGAGNGFQVFDTDGKSYPCHILSPLVLEGDKLAKVINGLVDKTDSFEDLDCVSCPFTSTCPTCIACNYLYRDSLQKRDKTHCKIMKVEVKAFIKKEVLRLTRKKQLTPEDAATIDSIRKIFNKQEQIFRIYH